MEVVFSSDIEVQIRVYRNQGRMLLFRLRTPHSDNPERDLVLINDWDDEKSLMDGPLEKIDKDREKQARAEAAKAIRRIWSKAIEEKIIYSVKIINTDLQRGKVHLEVFWGDANKRSRYLFTIIRDGKAIGKKLSGPYMPDTLFEKAREAAQDGFAKAFADKHMSERRTTRAMARDR